MSDPFVWSEPIPIDFEIDIRSEVKEIIEQRGHYVFLRKARQQRAPSFNQRTSEAKENDPFNHGVGFLYDDYLIKIRKRPTVDLTAGGPMKEIRTEIGFSSPRTFVMYLAHPPITSSPTIIPDISDMIIEVTLDDATGLPKLAYNIERIYDLQAVQEYRDKHGRIEYWSVLAQQRVIGK